VDFTVDDMILHFAFRFISARRLKGSNLALNTSINRLIGTLKTAEQRAVIQQYGDM